MIRSRFLAVMVLAMVGIGQVADAGCGGRLFRRAAKRGCTATSYAQSAPCQTCGTNTSYGYGYTSPTPQSQLPTTALPAPSKQMFYPAPR